MTLQEAENKIAQKYGYRSWAESHFELSDYKSIASELAELYARSKWDEACAAQKELIVVPQYMKQQIAEKEYEWFVHLSDLQFTILNATKPEFDPPDRIKAYERRENI